LGDFLIDTGFDESFAKLPPYGNYTEAMRFFNWVNGVTNRQEPIPTRVFLVLSSNED
jgi:hypothetical protein